MYLSRPSRYLPSMQDAAPEPPVWLLDVDGVINVRRPGWGAPPFHDVAYTGDIGWRLRWAPALTARIRRLHREGVAEVRWCSTWCSWPDELVRVLHMPG